MRRYSRTVSLFLIFLLTAGVTFVVAQVDFGDILDPPDTPEVTAKAPPKFRVQVVKDRDDGFEQQAESYIKRELRGLRDVEIVYEITDKPDWQLSILGFYTETEGGRKTGTTLSAVVTECLANNDIFAFALSLMTDNLNMKEVMADISSRIYEYKDHYLYDYEPDKLDEICKNVVTSFDIKWLEPERKRRKGDD